MKKKLLVTLLVITIGTVYASNHINVQKNKTVKKHFTQMSTTELQKEVEKLANANKLPFEMGLELMKRWQTEGKSRVN